MRKKKISEYIKSTIEIRKLEKYLQYYSEEPVQVIDSTDLINYSVDSLFDDSKRYFSVIFLQFPDTNIGHYVVLLFTGVNEKEQVEIEMFDSSCFPPHEDILNFAERNKCILTFYNPKEKPIQKPAANTCSRHVAMRISCASLGMNEYRKMIEGHSFLNADELVSSLVRFIE